MDTGGGHSLGILRQKVFEVIIISEFIVLRDGGVIPLKYGKNALNLGLRPLLLSKSVNVHFSCARQKRKKTELQTQL